jgi:hypothetical protein
MKDIVVTIILMAVSITNLNGQHMGIYVSEKDSNIFVSINKNDIEIYQVLDNFGVEDVFERNLILESKYLIVYDTIVLTRVDNHISFHVIAEGVLQIKDEISHYISSNTKFYCIRKKDENGRIVYFGKWKNGQKDGDWLYFNELGQRVIITYKNGTIIGRSNIKD